MLSFNEALQIIIQHAASFGKEEVSLLEVAGRILAEPVLADRDYPPFNRASMDGYAMKFEDVESGIKEFTTVEIIFAGQTPQAELKTGECYKIMTGAAVPPTANMIIQRELIVEKELSIIIPAGNFKAYQQIAKQGEDVKGGECVVYPPAPCTPALISAMAALGKEKVLVEKLPRVSIFTTGNEIVAPGEAIGAFQIRNSNQYMLRALMQQRGIEPFLCEHIRDDKQDLYKMLAKGLSGDIVVISGGVSAGDADYVPEVLESLGVKKLFHKVAIKPGKPVWCGHMPGGAMVFALPGNPFSGLVTFTLFVETFISYCFGLSNPPSMLLPLLVERSRKSNQDEFFPVKISASPLGVIPISFNGSGDILAAIHADGIAQHPVTSEILSAQAPVYVRLLRK